MRQPHGLPARQVGFFAQTLGKVVYLCFILLFINSLPTMKAAIRW